MDIILVSLQKIERRLSVIENKLEIAKFVRIKLRKKGKSKKMVKKSKLKTRKNK